MIARVPVYGTTDAGRNLYLRIKQELQGVWIEGISDPLRPVFHYRRRRQAVCCDCAHVDDFLWAATPPDEPVVQQLLDRFKIGRIESDKFRLCGREYVQHADGTIQINCRDNTHAIRPIDVHKSEKEATPVSSSQRTALRSVIGSLAWVARATRPDLAYRVKALQQQGVKATATVETLRDANRVVALALNDAERCITYKAKLQLPWSPGELAVVTFCDASFAGESEHKSRKGRFRYLTSAKVASDPDATHHEMHSHRIQLIDDEASVPSDPPM